MNQKTKLWLFYISTFGIGYLLAKNHAKKLKDNTNENIITSKATSKFDIDSLIDALGGKNNIIDVEATISNLKVTLKDNSLANQDQIKSLGIKGSFLNQNKITILLGDYSQDISEKLKNKIWNN